MADPGEDGRPWIPPVWRIQPSCGVVDFPRPRRFGHTRLRRDIKISEHFGRVAGGRIEDAPTVSASAYGALLLAARTVVTG